jgi:hypothetical protein
LLQRSDDQFHPNIQPSRVDVNPAARQAKSTTGNPHFAIPKIDRLQLERQKIASSFASAACALLFPLDG